MSSEVLERGSIYFLYRPKVRSPGENRPVESLDDVERTWIILSPANSRRYRRLAIGRKKLPDIHERNRYWGFVEVVGNRPEEVQEDLRERRYRTKTRGEREQPAARAAAEGVYAIARHGNHTHLAYALELPREPGEVQREMNIKSEASYVFTVKNPAAGAPPGMGLPRDEKAGLPPGLHEKFGSRRFIPVEPELLDYPGTEFILIGATEEPEEELGLDLAPEREDERSADIFTDLRLRLSEHPVEPLFEGAWD